MTALEIRLPEFVTGRDELAAGEAHARVGLLDGPPPADHTLVVCCKRHRYVDAARGVDFVALPGQHYFMADLRVANNVAAKLVRVPEALTLDWWHGPRRILAAEPCGAVPLVTEPRAASLKIVAGCGYDPGAAAFRLHTALNETTQHASVFVRWGDSNPHCSLRQYDGILDASLVRQAVEQADVLHHHVAPFLVNNTGMRPQRGQLVIRHYHGSKPNGSHLEPVFDQAEQYLLLGARLSLVAEARDFGLAMEWSPIPVPVARYRALRDAVRAEAGWVPLDGAATAKRPLRIAHSPTNERYKGTDVLRKVVHGLRAKGVPVEVDYIRGVSLAESLRRKALCDVCFDSFWLGLQGSGLEAGAMELPVIAGDRDAASLYEAEIGLIPYTFADNAAELSYALEQHAMSSDLRWLAASVTADYVAQHHDYAAVARRYEDTLSRALGRDVVTKRLDDGTVTDGIFVQKQIPCYQPPVGATIEIGDEQIADADADASTDNPRTLLGLPIVEDPTLDPGTIELRKTEPPRRQRRAT
jgi:hypothetical protein